MKAKIEMWTNVYISDVHDIQRTGVVDGPYYSTKEEADEAVVPTEKRVACVKMVGEVDVVP